MGFNASGYRTFRKLQVPHPHTAFVEAALKQRGERVPKRPKVTAASVGELIWSANDAFPLVTIHREKRNPDLCHIGRVIVMDKQRVSLLEINPGATWEAEPNQYPLNEITRVDFGGAYEDALHLVAGAAPSAK